MVNLKFLFGLNKRVTLCDFLKYVIGYLSNYNYIIDLHLMIIQNIYELMSTLPNSTSLSICYLMLLSLYTFMYTRTNNLIKSGMDYGNPIQNALFTFNRYQNACLDLGNCSIVNLTPDQE